MNEKSNDEGFQLDLDDVEIGIEGSSDRWWIQKEDVRSFVSGDFVRIVGALFSE